MTGALSITTRSPEQTSMLGAALAPHLLPGDVISLGGDIGAGKTILVKGIAFGLGVEGRVTSPTFTIVHEYHGHYPLVHLDVYRINSIQEMFDLGFEELLDPTAVLVVEWGEAVSPLLPAKHLQIDLEASPGASDERIISLTARGWAWMRKLEGMRATARELFSAAGAVVDLEQKWSRPPASPSPGTRDHGGAPEPNGDL
jgi:tRNA threonylcarbamoyladenosine biosynthesis protein TsaE